MDITTKIATEISAKETELAKNDIIEDEVYIEAIRKIIFDNLVTVSYVITLNKKEQRIINIEKLREPIINQINN